MKKLLSLLLVAMMCLSAASAIAEGDALQVPEIENGGWLAFEDYNIQICLPNDWLVLEVNEEQAASGVFFVSTNPESTRSLTLAYSELEEASDIEGVLAALSAAYEETSLLYINDIPFVTYTIAENDVTGLVTLGGAGIGLYQFVFYPASDEAFGSLALQIAASISALE